MRRPSCHTLHHGLSLHIGVTVRHAVYCRRSAPRRNRHKMMPKKKSRWLRHAVHCRRSAPGRNRHKMVPTKEKAKNKKDMASQYDGQGPNAGHILGSDRRPRTRGSKMQGSAPAQLPHSPPRIVTTHRSDGATCGVLPQERARAQPEHDRSSTTCTPVVGRK